MSETTSNPTSVEVREAYNRYTLSDSIRNAKVACMLVFLLMPFGYILDWYVYHEQVNSFFKWRLVASALAALNLYGLYRKGLTDFTYRVLCMVWYLIPSFFISRMISVTEGASSPYYAGLNLVILAVSSVIQATMAESLRAIAIIVTMYLAACFLQPSFVLKDFVNNFYFTFCTAGIVVTGNYFYNRLRFREFSLRFELDRNKQMLEESNNKLREMDEVKSRVFANISHELRTPLTLLLAPLETLIHRFSKSFDEDSRNLLVTMHSNGMRLLKLISDLLDLVRLESGVMIVKREPLDMAECIKGLASAARQMADDKRIKLETFVDPQLGTVMADRDKLEKIILNLQFNALKFTPAGGRVELRAEKIGEQMGVQGKDTGMGISQKNLPHGFDRFWAREDPSRRKYQGVGIGLALVKELTEIQEGTVSLESEEGKGTTFTVKLPYTRATAEGTPSAEAGSNEPAVAVSTGGTVSSEEWLTNLYRRAELFPAMTAVQDTLRPLDTGSNSV